ncbi:MAG: phosphate transport system regulatory protein PhoU [Ignavibacteria bacterium GWA2_55_11]|nr:MAG: phosphate transport system regulatory protein PhoU [Ignavibacteria bacterium GWA2_55_11]OGU47643.1 MAG: phosphate transport system regulatory protein PhoU [Ignavibacteria bacterium GWC2_56_12]OGU62705.1 MAG: phosphate transport system regulatory protein PhoU [Ignavibacteria bacterium RIFCSPHIGHO2_02_FULL_56_12]OGU70516.1 MAG: phosphate transport system regulatory protein PhoU [Ignavibacteria bacterium RIFCSPLOWO2_02_FULL_55_14]OGU72386.1 MAG: phosphate transport system regulatory protei
MDQRHLDVELQRLNEKLQAMAFKVQAMLGRSMEAIRRKDAAMAKSLFALDKEVDQLEIDIEEDAVALIARHQPAAGDLRFLIGVIKINNDLERIGDHGVNIAQAGITLAGLPDIGPIDAIVRMNELAAGMLSDSIQSFVGRDPVTARQVCERDDEVDGLNDQVLNELSRSMSNRPETIDQAVSFILVSRNLERIADLATNISEETIYICQAKVIKHRFGQQAE